MAEPSRKIDPVLLQKTGKVRVQIWLTNTSADTIAQLKNLGVDTSTLQSGKPLIVSVDAAKLLEVAKLAAVRYISI